MERTIWWDVLSFGATCLVTSSVFAVVFGVGSHMWLHEGLGLHDSHLQLASLRDS
jgi:hypothetical protein